MRKRPKYCPPSSSFGPARSPRCNWGSYRNLARGADPEDERVDLGDVVPPPPTSLLLSYAGAITGVCVAHVPTGRLTRVIPNRL